MVDVAYNLTEVAIRFLRTGRPGTVDSSSLVAECDRLVRRETQRSLRSAVRMAKRFTKYAAKFDEPERQTALRALGWACHCSAQYSEAEKAYLQARALNRSNKSMRARIDRILIDVYMYLGRPGEARRRARLAMRTFARLKDDDGIAKTRVNYANLLHRQDRHREAGQQYRRAESYFREHQDHLTLALCCYNHANTLAQLFEFKETESLYREAHQLFDNLGFSLYATESKYGMAWLHLLEGNYHVALSELAACEAEYRRAAQPKGQMLCELDRAEALLGLNLFSDAAKLARSAEKSATRLGLNYESAKAAFFLAKAEFALGHDRSMITALGRARAGFLREDNSAFLAAVDLTEVQTQSPGKLTASKLRSARRRFSKAQLPLWEAICDLQVLAERPDDPTLVKRLQQNPAVRSVPCLTAQWQSFLGDWDAQRGRMKAAKAHWKKAVEVLDGVRAKLPPVEMRSTFMKRRSDPYLRLISHEMKTDPRQAAVWSERYKTAGLWAMATPESARDNDRIRAEHSLSELAEQVTAFSSRLNPTSGQRSAGSPHAIAAIARQQHKARQDLTAAWHPKTGHIQGMESLTKLIESLSRRQPIIQFHYDGAHLVGFIHEAGQSRCHRYEFGRQRLHELLACWRILLGRNIDSEGTVKARLVEERRLFTRLGDWLWAPLEVSSRAKHILVVPEGRLYTLPWLAILHNRQPLVNHHSFIVSPSLRHHRHALDRQVRSRRINVFVGNQSGLSQAHQDAHIFKDRDDANTVVFDPCKREDWPNEESARIWHYAGHAHLRGDNPFYSSLEMADGPMFAADFRLRRNNVGLVTLAACRTAHQSMLPGEESAGLVRSLLEMGARNVVGGHWAVSDRSTVCWMNEFYKNIFNGLPIHKSAQAASISIREKYQSAYDWAAFSVYGAG